MNKFHLNKYALLTIGAVGILLALTLFFKANSQPMAGAEPPVQTISETTLKEQYGIQINLIAVTAAGGLVDFRMQILDAEKARLLISDRSKMPVLFIEEIGITLRPPEDSSTQELTLENDKLFYNLFSNPQGLIQPGTPITVIFGEIGVEPMISK